MSVRRVPRAQKILQKQAEAPITGDKRKKNLPTTEQAKTILGRRPDGRTTNLIPEEGRLVGISADETREIKRVYIEEIARTGSFVQAAKAAGYSSYTFRMLRGVDPEFDRRVCEAWDHTVSLLEEKMMHRAVHGYKEPVFHMGEVCGHKTKHDPLVQIFMLKANRREKYGDHVKITQTPEEFAAKARSAMIHILQIHGMSVPQQNGHTTRVGVFEIPPKKVPNESAQHTEKSGG